MTDHALRPVADFVLGMIGQCRNLDELLAVQRNPSFIRRLETLRRSYGGAALFEEATNAMDAKLAEFSAQSEVEKEERK